MQQQLRRRKPRSICILLLLLFLLISVVGGGFLVCCTCWCWWIVLFFPVVCCNVYLLLLVMFDLCYCCRCCIFGSCVVYVIGDVVCCCLLLLLLSPLVVVFVVLTSFSLQIRKKQKIYTSLGCLSFTGLRSDTSSVHVWSQTLVVLYTSIFHLDRTCAINFTLSYRTIVFDIIFITIPCISLLFTRLWSSKVSYSTKTCIYNTLHKQNSFL